MIGCLRDGGKALVGLGKHKLGGCEGGFSDYFARLVITKQGGEQHGVLTSFFVSFLWWGKGMNN